MASRASPLPIPFEWFTGKIKGKTSRLLVLWLDEDALGDSPLERYAELLCPSGSPPPWTKAKVPRWSRAQVLGPFQSTALKAMVDEIVEQQSRFREGGGEFIVPVPELRII